MKKETANINLILAILLTGLFSCTGNRQNPDPSTDSDSILFQKDTIDLINNLDTCGIDSIIKNGDFLFSNQDSVSIISNEQLLYPLDMRVRKILKNYRYGDYYYVSSYDLLDNISMFTYYEDETESPTVYLATIKNCELVSKIAIGFGSAWEHGNKTTKSVIHDNMTIDKISYSASRDWGDYTEWKYDTTITRYKINDNGLIEELK